MSMTYWMIEGIGLKVSDIKPHIDKEKAARFFYEQFPDNTELGDMVISGNCSDFDMEEYCYNRLGFDNLASVLCYCDDTDSLTFCDDGDGSLYFYYPPSMPWERTSNEPQSERDVIDRIVKAVQKITDMTYEEIEKLIDNDLYVVGIG